MIQLVLSRWNDSEHASRFHRDKFTTIAVPIAYLRLFRIGDLWANGERIGTDENFVQETFEHLTINDTTVKVAPAGLPLNQDSTPLYPLPFSALEAHRGHTGAFCARVSIGHDATLVVSCTELVRFYFGASGGLLKHLFSGALASRQLYTSAQINYATGVAHLDLFPGLPGVAASTVGRIAFDQQARKAMRWLINSGVSAAANKERHYPRTTFPLLGETNLTAQGRWINHKNHQVFLAERLIQCTHPFPFKTLFYTSHLNLSSLQKSVSSQPEKIAHPHKDSPPKIELVETLVASTLQPVALKFTEDIDCAFPDLISKPVRRVNRDRSGMSQQATQQSTLGTGERLSTSDIQEAEVTTENAEDDAKTIYPETVEFMFEEINGVSERMENRVMLLHPRSKDGQPWEESFVQANTLTSIADPRLKQIWAAQLIFNRTHDSDFLLLLVKHWPQWSGSRPSDHDQFALFRYEAGHDPDGNVLEKHLLDFAHMEPERSLNGVYLGGMDHIGNSLIADRFLSFFTMMLGRDPELEKYAARFAEPDAATAFYP